MHRHRPITRVALATLALLIFLTHPAAAATGLVNAVNVRFRSVPNTSSSGTILKLLAKGTALELVAREQDWYQVKLDGTTGYVYALYVTVQPDPAPKPEPVAAPDPAPATAVAAVTSPQPEEVPEPAATSEQTGEPAGPEAVPAEAASTSEAAVELVNRVVVEANTLNVRQAATAESALLGKITFGQEATLLERSADWAKIRTESGLTGYVLGKYLVSLDTTVSRGSSELVDELIAYAMSLQGVRYVYGGMSLKGFDCSGFTRFVYQAVGVSTPRSSHEYGSVGEKVARSALRPGDVLLWDTDGRRVTNISHVGIYLGNDKFIHASTTMRKVVVASVSGYQATYLGARRFLK